MPQQQEQPSPHHRTIPASSVYNQHRTQSYDNFAHNPGTDFATYSQPALDPCNNLSLEQIVPQFLNSQNQTNESLEGQEQPLTNPPPPVQNDIGNVLSAGEPSDNMHPWMPQSSQQQIMEAHNPDGFSPPLAQQGVRFLFLVTIPP